MKKLSPQDHLALVQKLATNVHHAVTTEAKPATLAKHPVYERTSISTEQAAFDISHVPYEEETVAVVFTLLNTGAAVTRHYQPRRYFGDKTKAEIAKLHDQIKAQIIAKFATQIPPKELEERIKRAQDEVNVKNTEHYHGTATRQYLEELEIDAIAFLQTGELPVPV